MVLQGWEKGRVGEGGKNLHGPGAEEKKMEVQGGISGSAPGNERWQPRRGTLPLSHFSASSPAERRVITRRKGNVGETGGQDGRAEGVNTSSKKGTTRRGRQGSIR